MQNRKRESVINADATVLTQGELNLLFDRYNELKKAVGLNLGSFIMNKISHGLLKDANQEAPIEYFEMYYTFIYLCFKHMMGSFGEDIYPKKTYISSTEELREYNSIIEQSLFEEKKESDRKQGYVQKSIDMGGFNLPIGAKWSEEAFADLINICFEFADPNIYPGISRGEQRVKWMSERLEKLNVKYFQKV